MTKNYRVNSIPIIRYHRLISHNIQTSSILLDDNIELPGANILIYVVMVNLDHTYKLAYFNDKWVAVADYWFALGDSAVNAINLIVDQITNIEPSMISYIEKIIKNYEN